MTGLAGPFLWFTSITTRAISSVVSVCQIWNTSVQSIQIAALLLERTKVKGTLTKDNVQD